jgi:transcriptional regulator with PAS, ATPase and Fis domain
MARMRRFHDLVTANRRMAACFDTLLAYARSDEPVLLIGESGTGKEGLARGLHAESGRTGAFVALNCGAIPPPLVDSELFGYAAGAFTGAEHPRSGAFEAAHEGTLFLDELGELPPDAQVRLLRVLEGRAVRRVGEAHERPIDVRVVAATHQPLRRMVEEGSFRGDLYHRLYVLPLELPPLRERPEDVRLLAAALLPPDTQLSARSLRALLDHDWPGNVRELRNALIRGTLRSQGIIEPVHLGLQTSSYAPTAREADQARCIRRALSDSGGNRAQAARMLGLPRSTFCDRMRRWGLVD